MLYYIWTPFLSRFILKVEVSKPYIFLLHLNLQLSELPGKSNFLISWTSIQQGSNEMH